MINTYINIASLATNIILNILLIPQYGIAGAAYATTISYSLVFIIRSIVYSKISGNRIRDFIFIKLSDLKFYLAIINLVRKKQA